MTLKNYLFFLFVILSFNYGFAQSEYTIDWSKAKWIGYAQDVRPSSWSSRVGTFKQNGVYPKSYASPLLRMGFELTKNVESAQVAVCGLGLYELYLNGDKVGDRVLDPAQTSYDEHAFYVVHDVTSLLKLNKNAIGLMIGSGFYGQNTAYKPDYNYGQPRAIAILSIKYSDGTGEEIVTDESWKATNSPILFDNIYLGETYDARQSKKEWSSPEFDDSAWNFSKVMSSPTQMLLEQTMEPMRKIRSVEPIAILPAENGWIIDMGQNLTGWLQIRVEEAEGTVIKMRFAELLLPDKKNIDPASTGVHVTGDTQTDYYICSGSGLETWEPRFTYHGFRYVQIEGLSKKPELKDYTGWLVRTDVDKIGTFECSDPLINKFYNVSMWTIEDNLQGLLTDCPHRERCAWTGDAYAVSEAATYNFKLDKFWRKTITDLKTTLGKANPHKDDGLPKDPRAPANISVGKRLSGQSRPDWGAATIMIPWYSYLHYGDTSIIENSWSMMNNWMDFMHEFMVKDGIISLGNGDWCPPGSNLVMNTPPALTSTALYYQSLRTMRKMALLMNDVSASQKYANKAIDIKNAFNQMFFYEETNSYGSQTGNAVALQTQIVPEGKEQAVADRLADFVLKDSQGHYSTGIFGHRPLYTILNDYGYAKITRHLWSITDFPSLGFLTEEHDLTTWPETPYDWPKNEPYRRNSFNHAMHSGFAATFHESLGGIRPDEEYAGFKKFFLRPTFIPNLEWVNVSHQSPQGEIKSAWKREGEYIKWSVDVPQNSSAQVQLPAFAASQITLNESSVDANTFTLTTGEYLLSIKLDSAYLSAEGNLVITPFTEELPVYVKKQNYTVNSVDAEQNANVASKLYDGIITDNSRWSASGFPKSAVIDLGEEKEIVGTRLWTSSDRAYQFKVEVSSLPTSGFSEVVDRTKNTSFTQPIANNFAMQKGRYVKLTVTGCYNYEGAWVSINELALLFSDELTRTELVKENTDCVSLFPNPTSSSFRIVLKGINTAKVQVYNISGTLIYEGMVSEEYLDLNSGIYLVKVIANNQSVYCKKLVVN